MDDGDPGGRATLRLRIEFADGTRLGPGKADLLEAIRAEGSIAAAGRRMGMSYKRAWQLVEALNAAFATPLVESARGGASGGGARLTDTGAEVLARYRSIESGATRAAAGDLAALSPLLKGREA